MVIKRIQHKESEIIHDSPIKHYEHPLSQADNRDRDRESTILAKDETHPLTNFIENERPRIGLDDSYDPLLMAQSMLEKELISDVLEHYKDRNNYVYAWIEPIRVPVKEDQYWVKVSDEEVKFSGANRLRHKSGEEFIAMKLPKDLYETYQKLQHQKYREKYGEREKTDTAGSMKNLIGLNSFDKQLQDDLNNISYGHSDTQKYRTNR